MTGPSAAPPRRVGLRRGTGLTYPVLSLALGVVLLAAFAVVEALQVPLLTDPMPTLRAAGPLAAVIGFGLLLADVAVPVPASIVMTGHGALFGAVGGAVLSVTGGTGATVVAVALGRWGRAPLERRIPAERRRRAQRLVERHGTAALVLSRPLPILAETVAVVAGTTGLSLRRAAWAGALGNLVPAAVYAVAGATAVTLGGAVLVLGGAAALAALTWMLQARVGAQAAVPAAATAPTGMARAR